MPGFPWIRAALGCSLLALAAAQPAAAVTFNFTKKEGDTLTAEQAAAFTAAAAVWSAALTDKVTVNVQIGFTALADRVLGSTQASLVYAPSSIVALALADDASSAADRTAVATYNAGTAANTVMTAAEARALGFLTIGTTDGSIEFSSAFTFATARNANGTIAPDAYDLIGIAEHEIGHLLGFLSGIDYDQRFQTVLDRFRYAAPATPSFSNGAAAYFSFDGGATDFADFATGSGNQASHWAIGTLGVPLNPKP